MDADVRHGHPCRHVPVDSPYVIAGFVGAHLGELGTATQLVGAELPRHEAVDPAPDGDVEGPEQRLGGGAGTWSRRRARRGRPGPGCRGPCCRGPGDTAGDHADSSSVTSLGAGTAGMIASSIRSGVTSSARAVKLGTIRWRRTSRARSATSAGMT